MEKKNEILTPHIMKLIRELEIVAREYDNLSDEVYGRKTEECNIETLVGVAISNEIKSFKESIDNLNDIKEFRKVSL